MNAATKSPVLAVTITRAEGPAALCDEPRTFRGATAWADAAQWLARQSRTFPVDSYHKHDLFVVWQNGTEFDGRLDCSRDGVESSGFGVARRVRESLEFAAGVRCPRHMTDVQYRAYLAQVAAFAPNNRATAAGILDTCEIP